MGQSNVDDPRLEISENDELFSLKWNSLPDILVIQIYGYLDDRSRLCMACVCKRWKELFYTPSLWRYRRVHFCGRKAKRIAERECQYIETMGRHLKTLCLSFGKPSYRTVKTMSQAAETYLKYLLYEPRLRLTEFILQHVDMEHYWPFWISRNKIVSTLCRLFRRLRHIDTLNITSCRISLMEGCRLLESLGRGYAGRTLKVLSADDLFQTNILPIRHRRYVNLMSKFTSLTHVYLNYGAINADILDIFAENLKETLRKLTLSIENNVSHIVIPSTVWLRFKRSCPCATATFYMYVTGLFYDSTAALVKGIPLTELDAVSWATIAARDDMQSQIPILLRHVGRTYATTLEQVNLQLDQNPPIDDALLFMMTSCRRLRQLHLCCKLKVPTIEKIGLLQRQNKIHLHILTLNLHGLNEKEYQQLRKIQPSLVDAISGRVQC